MCPELCLQFAASPVMSEQDLVRSRPDSVVDQPGELVAEVNPFRLPRTVEPEHYELTLTPDIPNATFAGEEKVKVAVKEAVTEIKLNAAELEILTAEIVDAAGTVIAGSAVVDEDSEVATITLAEPAQPGQWTVHLTFAGTLNDKLRGFYRSTFKADNGDEHVIATTQFEATDARRAFPCWDEPDFKAVFAVTLIVDEQLVALSNAAVREESNLGNGKRQVEFVDTMKMSTYLVAFVVGPLTITDAVDVDGVPLRVACVPGREALGAFALEIGAAGLRFYCDYFKIPYPGGKLDLISIPDFAFGAMENLGCVTFRETALLVDPERASRLEVERVADVVAHEIAHMWFGDLVTMKWWNGIWLNEAFATFMEVLMVDNFRPEWEKWVSFGLGKAAAMNLDSLSSTRPIEFEVIRPEEAQGMFDLLTYQKGGAVLRMLEQHLGAQEFANGIAAYLKKHSYDNAETTDLWDALEESSKQPVRSMMDSWIFQGGHPIVSVSMVDSTTVELKQSRFQYISDGTPNPRWHIPIGIRASINGELHHEKLVLTDESTTVTLPGKADWLVVNERANGFFRVSYESDLLANLRANLSELDSLERFTIATDTWAACIAGQGEVADLIELLRLMKHDDDPNVWGTILGPLRLIDKVVSKDTRAKLEAFVREIAAPAYERLGWEPKAGEGERAATLRAVIISALGAFGKDEAVRAEAIRRYEAYATDASALDPNLIEAVETTLASTNEIAFYEQLHKKFTDTTSSPQEQVNALEALACFTDPALVERTLKMVETGEVRTQDAPYTVRLMLNRRESGPRVWEWCEEHWDNLMDRFPDNSIARMLDGVTGQTDAVLADRVQAFMATHPVPQAQKAVDQTCERLRVNVAFAKANADKVNAAFD